MKKLSFSLLAMVALMFILFAFSSALVGGIRGKVFPIEGADKAMAISGKDTVLTDVVAGSFYFPKVKKGTYTVWLHGKAPFKDTPVENVAVIDSAVTDIGEIKLVQ
ncbi:MAG: carboxypeptidase regulatory-like domain-containing protein [Bacteroidota bacterium]